MIFLAATRKIIEPKCKFSNVDWLKIETLHLKLTFPSCVLSKTRVSYTHVSYHTCRVVKCVIPLTSFENALCPWPIAIKGPTNGLTVKNICFSKQAARKTPFRKMFCKSWFSLALTFYFTPRGVFDKLPPFLPAYDGVFITPQRMTI